jgi:hypothetical protein
MYYAKTAERESAILELAAKVQSWTLTAGRAREMITGGDFALPESEQMGDREEERRPEAEKGDKREDRTKQLMSSSFLAPSSSSSSSTNLAPDPQRPPVPAATPPKSTPKRGGTKRKAPRNPTASQPRHPHPLGDRPLPYTCGVCGERFRNLATTEKHCNCCPRSRCAEEGHGNCIRGTPSGRS